MNPRDMLALFLLIFAMISFVAAGFVNNPVWFVCVPIVGLIMMGISAEIDAREAF